MDKLAKYRQTIESVLTGYAEIPYRYADLYCIRNMFQSPGNHYLHYRAEAFSFFCEEVVHPTGMIAVWLLFY